jgi:hypothetical protein
MCDLHLPRFPKKLPEGEVGSFFSEKKKIKIFFLQNFINHFAHSILKGNISNFGNTSTKVAVF